MPDLFSANASALGYFYQSRYALFLILQGEQDCEISIEKFDDVAFENNGTPSEMLQLKHHITNTGSLSDASTDLWRTLRVWSTRLANDSENVPNLFTLITTGKAPSGSAAEKLRPSSHDSDGALELLVETARTSESRTNKKAYEAFLGLEESSRKKLLERVRVLDAASDIADVESKIREQLRFATRPQFLDPVVDRLQSWWFRRVIEHLLNDSSGTISQRELLDALNDIQEDFHHDNLPIDFLNAIAPDESELTAEQRIFILQLKLIAVGQNRIRRAINDYYRAFEQRSRWMREDLLGVGELDAYENRLIDEWGRRFEIMKEDLADDEGDSVYEQAGRKLFNHIDTDLSVHIRPKCTEPYVMRGSYHMLANNRKVGWHALFLDRLSTLLSEAHPHNDEALV